MTPQEKLHAVSTDIRKALPRLMEPTEGCYFIDRTFGYRKVKYLHKCQRDNKEYILDEDGVVCWYDYYDKEIIGHDILLSDVLEWFDKLKFNPNEPVSLLDEILTEQGIISIIALWCLSKPRLADQSEELWNFLYNLLEDNE